MGVMQVHKMDSGWSIQTPHCLVAEKACSQTHNASPPTPSEYIGLAEIINVDQFLHSYTTNGSCGSCMHAVPYFLPWYIYS